jgi:folate-binding protein YgfZ
MTDPRDAYHAAARSAGFFDRSDRVRIEVGGPDRAKFLHNLTTSDVKRLAVGRGQEAFITSPQGKTLGHVTLLAGPDRILLRSDGPAPAGFLPHLEKYGVFDEVALDDASCRTFEFHLAGPAAEAVLTRAGGTPLPPGDLAHAETELAGTPVRVVREAPYGLPGLTLIGPAEQRPAVATRLRAEGEPLGLVDVPAESAEALRIEAGTPAFGRDVTPENLPQEIGRDERAISFVKGCYLGQETVARIDALGHVNKLLKGVRLLQPGPVPPAGATIAAAGQSIGKITSAADSPGWGVPVALAVLKATQARAGLEVEVQFGDAPAAAVVCYLPMHHPADQRP